MIILAPFSKDSIKFPKLYLNGTHTKSGEYLAPNSIVFFVMGGAGIILCGVNFSNKKLIGM